MMPLKHAMLGCWRIFKPLHLSRIYDRIVELLPDSTIDDSAFWILFIFHHYLKGALRSFIFANP